MSNASLSSFLLGCVLCNYAVMFAWFCAFVCAHGWMYRLHSRWFHISEQQFDAIHYGGMSVYKIGIMLFNLVPWIVLQFVTKNGG